MNTIAFIGGGNMASAVIGGLLKSGRSPADILVLEPNADQRSVLQRDLGVITLEAPGSVLQRADVAVWAVKPQVFKEAAAPVAQHLGKALQFSVMAGIRSDAIVAALGTERVIRAMPNTPALIGQGIAGLYARPAVTPQERKDADRLLAPTGRMVQAAEEMGLTAEQGKQLALATFSGAASLAQASSEPPSVLRERVTSKGGTTYAALTSMESSGVKAAFVKAMKAAQRRAGELGNEFG